VELTIYDLEVNMETIVNEGGLIGITGGMQQYPDHAGIQQSGCGALWNLSPLGKHISMILFKILSSIFPLLDSNNDYREKPTEDCRDRRHNSNSNCNELSLKQF
jgi:hypothetical protein